MEELYQQYQGLSAGQLKLLCFLAYVGQPTDRIIQNLWTRGEDVNAADMKKTLNSLRRYFTVNFYSYSDNYQIHPYHVAPLLLYMIERKPQWIEHFDKFYKDHQHKNVQQLYADMVCCLKGEKLNDRYIRNRYGLRDMLVPLASDERFLPMMESMLDVARFVQEVLVYQVEHDISDPLNVVGTIADRYVSWMSRNTAEELQEAVALYDFFKQGRYNAKVAKQKGFYSRLLEGVHALYAGYNAAAYTALTDALRIYNAGMESTRKGFFGQLLNNFLLVLAFYMYPEEGRKKLNALLNRKFFVERSEMKPAMWLASYLTFGVQPSTRTVSAYLNDPLCMERPLYGFMARLVARFLRMNVEMPDSLSATPHLWILSHELSPWLELPDEAKEQLADSFGGSPLVSRLRYKELWERVLEELTPQQGEQAKTQEKMSRVSYIVNGSQIEVREQTRLKSGQWGAGKRMSMDTFRRGTDFMDDADRQVAASMTPYNYHPELGSVLRWLAGSDRVYTGRNARYSEVTIEEEKPYLIIERSNTAFKVKSNIGGADLAQPVIYRKDSETHYTVFSVTERQRNYYQKLLSVGAFPLEAEGQLRDFLPKVSDVVEVHSDLVEGGTTLQQCQGTSQLCLQVVPADGETGHFFVHCMARPLTDGKTVFEPGKGLNPCVVDAGGTRYQVSRDMRSERANLQLLRTFIDDNSLSLDDIDDIFVDRQPATVEVEGLLCLMDFVREQKEQFYMEWPKGGRLNLKRTNPASWNIVLQSKNGWFEVEGEVHVDQETVLTVGQLMQLIAECPRSGFIRLSDTDFLALSDRLRKQLERLESLTVSNRGHLQISELHASLLGSALNGEVDIKHDRRIDELQKKIKKSMAQQPVTPRHLKAELRGYQLDGFQWMSRMTGWGAGVCLADDMGLGKTIQTIAFMLHTASDGPALVAAPASVVFNWQRELGRFAPSLHVEVLNVATDRQAVIDAAAAGDVLLTTYGLLVTEGEALCAKQWNTICLDEAHVIKNRHTKTSASVMKMQARNRIILTGTPVQNHLDELWNLFQFINPGLLGGYDYFHRKYIVPIELQSSSERSRQLKRIIQPFMLRRTKQEVVEELPEKTEITMPVELSDDELAVYEVIRQRAKQLLEDEPSAASVSINTLAEITRLRQAACSAQLAEANWKGECSKLNVLKDLLDEIVGGGNSVLVFSQFTSFLSMVRKLLDMQKTPYLYLDGAVPVRQRDQLVQQFQHGRCPVFLISLKAGGLGLNLTSANYVIHLDPWWNPAIEQQATDRAYRIGQRQSVTVYHLISQHTIEEKILRLHQTKRNLADAMLSGTSESHKLTSKDLLDMISL
ncbi:MAG: DEAD/DEAH box helicase [Prevotella sp.]|nr:DEAD/DEAH box helicase [Prevotella sp.]